MPMRLSIPTLCALLLAAAPLDRAVAQTGAPIVLEEIVVTALKRGEAAISETPIAISAFSGDSLERQGADGLSDFLQTAPGAGIIETQTGTNIIQIRGISAQIGDATVGFYLDDMPVTLVSQTQLPDVRTFDLERVEVLRGPQGTLYGASSQGGTVRILTRNPDLERFEVKGDASFSNTDEGEDNYSLNGSLNLPLVEGRFATRFAAGYSELGGWIDDPLTGAQDINGSEVETYRAKALFAATDRLKLTASAWLSRVANGSNNQSTADGLRPGAGTNESTNFEYDLVSTTAEYTTGAITLYNALSHMKYDQDFVTQVPVVSRTAYQTDVMTDEFRVTSAFSGPFNFLLGAFYANAESEIAQDIMLTPSQRDTLDSKAWAVFGEAYYAPSESRWELTAGLRYFEDERSTADHLPTTAAFLGLLGFPNPRKGTVDALTPRLNVAFRANEDALLYMNIAKGFRSGALQPGVSLISAGLLGVLNQVPAVIQPENLWTYESGVKLTALAGGALDVEAAVYYNDWKDLILFLPLAGFPTAYAVNGPEAESYGLDLVLTARPAKGLTLSIGGNINEAQYAESRSIFAKGDRIDNVPSATLNAAIDYARGIRGTLSAFGHFDLQHTEDRNLRTFAPTVPTPIVIDAQSDAITVSSLRIGLQSEAWTVALFVDNLFEEDGAVDPISQFTPLGVRLRPRTVGINLKVHY
jgi:outer membrane receptor protein involved in Fe transport